MYYLRALRHCQFVSPVTRQPIELNYYCMIEHMGRASPHRQHSTRLCSVGLYVQPAAAGLNPYPLYEATASSLTHTVPPSLATRDEPPHVRTTPPPVLYSGP